MSSENATPGSDDSHGPEDPQDVATEDHSQLLFEQQNNRQDSCFSASEKRDEELRSKVDVPPMKLGVVEIT